MMDHPNNQQGHCGCHGSTDAKQHAASETRSGGSALDILDERFARGEIDKAEYLEKKQLISLRDPPKAKMPDPHQPPAAAKPPQDLKPPQD